MHATVSYEDAFRLYPVQVREILGKLTKSQISHLDPSQLVWQLSYGITIGPHSQSITQSQLQTYGHTQAGRKATISSQTLIPAIPVPPPIQDVLDKAAEIARTGQPCPYPTLADLKTSKFHKDCSTGPQAFLVGGYAPTKHPTEVRLLFWNGRRLLGIDVLNALPAVIPSTVFFPQASIINRWKATKEGGTFSWRNKIFQKLTPAECLPVLDS